MPITVNQEGLGSGLVHSRVQASILAGARVAREVPNARGVAVRPVSTSRKQNQPISGDADISILALT
jgi:hypothetical protein